MSNNKLKTSLNIASVQMHITQDQDTNLNRMEEYLLYIQKTFPQIDMVVFPELCAMNIGKNMKEDAQEIPGPLTNIFSDWAKNYKLWIIPGSMYELSDDNLKRALEDIQEIMDKNIKELNEILENKEKEILN